MTATDPIERVLDASTAAAAYFEEVQSEKARAALFKVARFHSPDLLLLEIGNVAAKKLRRAEVDAGAAAASVTFAQSLVVQFHDDRGLAGTALSLAIAHGFSSYDACYLALAERLGIPVLTADHRLVQRAQGCGLGGLVEPVT